MNFVKFQFLDVSEGLVIPVFQMSTALTQKHKKSKTFQGLRRAPWTIDQGLRPLDSHLRTAGWESAWVMEYLEGLFYAATLAVTTAFKNQLTLYIKNKAKRREYKENVLQRQKRAPSGGRMAGYQRVRLAKFQRLQVRFWLSAVHSWVSC